MFRVIQRSQQLISHAVTFQPVLPNHNLFASQSRMLFSTDSYSENNNYNNTSNRYQNRPGKYYSLHEVEWVRMQDAKDQFKELSESQYYNDSDQQRAQFLSRQKGLFRKKELKFKLEYLMKLRDKEMYQQQKVAEFLQLAIKYIEKETQKIAARDTQDKNSGQDNDKETNISTATATVAAITPPKNPSSSSEPKQPLIPPRTLATQELEFVNYLRNFSELLAYMGVVDSVSWRALLEAVVFMSKKYAFTYNMVKIYSTLDMFTKRFSAENSDTFMHKRVIGSSQIVSVFSPKLLLQLLMNIQQANKNLDLEQIRNQSTKYHLVNHKEDYLHPKAFVLPLFYASSIIWKVQKASNVMLSGFDMMKIFATFQPTTLAMLPQLDVGSAISLFYSFATTGSASVELQAAFNQYFLLKIKDLSGIQSNVYKLLGIWTMIGHGSQELFNGLLSNGGIRLPKYQQNLSYQQSVSPVQLLKLLSIPAQTNIAMEKAFLVELLKQIISNCRNNEVISSLSAFQLEAAYNSLVFIYMFYPEAITSELINSSFYLAVTEQMKTHGVVRSSGTQKKESILDLQKIVSNVIAELKIKYQENQDDVVLILPEHQMRKQEHICVKSLTWWLKEVGLDQEIYVSVNKKISLYELDILLYSKSLDKAIAIEISGNNYVNIDGSLVGKRQLKDKVLKKAGIEIRYFSVTEDGVFNNHIALSASRKNSKVAIAEEIFKLAEDAFGKTFEKRELEQKQIFKSGSMKNERMQQSEEGNEENKD